MSYLQRLEEEVDTRHVIHDAIATIFAAFDQRLEDIEAEKLEAPLATELAMAKLHKLINLATMPYDGVTHPDEVFERMTPDGEPYPDKIDSWARGIGKSLATSRTHGVSNANGFACDCSNNAEGRRRGDQLQQGSAQRAVRYPQRIELPFIGHGQDPHQQCQPNYPFVWQSWFRS